MRWVQSGAMARATSALKKASDAAGAYPLNGVTRYLPRIIEPQLLFDVSAMRFNRLWAEVQCFGHGFHFFAFADALENFQLAIG